MGSQENGEKLGRIDLEIIAIGKRTKLSFCEMNELTVRELFEYVRAYTGVRDDEAPRKAAQADIDKFYAN